MSKKKGDRRERMGREIFTESGFFVENPNFSRFQNKDFYNLHDFMAVHPQSKVIFVQVKSGTASGINNYIEECAERFSAEHTQIFYMVYHKREGWRLIEIDLTDKTRTVIVDERETTNNMGEDVKTYLETQLLSG